MTNDVKLMLDRDQILKRGDEAAKALLGSLGSKLKAAMKSGGPENALEVCRQAAIPSTTNVSQRFKGLRISRISTKPRNPANAATVLDRMVLETWASKLALGDETLTDVVHQNSGGKSVFFRPIRIKAVCLKCHGDSSQFSSGLSVKLAKFYPQDKATGYKLGELRGAFKVEFE